ncbi:serpin peptidase inhibitor, clade A (alpha-1 antiproteinase, antitrypsin), member 10a [Salarias fasciatus]|uniref:serpin peptidase inhibitor, clade A (alpha-1 antiproteinase, antitrypsin), member 10a n=1 Tax=Salarias fasciatus TaxID=181472 RepID=UPI001176FF14|nr:protein Z-dependent protease inhibitor-like [Salarias fasciatus]XP_029966052.1 protein Z-dependent protease inhibitor-like [Salarias fasciatus]XP_029966053.1 protein Z-dependent protease inhibitor-like [Salarias fasciatus]XP_029966054.1 protein Z-dependent protease inhibitor-like [Salarias fasciatus]
MSPVWVLVGVLLVLVPLDPTSSQSTDPSTADLVNRNADFATRLYRAVAGRTDDNVAVCPFALSAGLTALASGSEGQTRDQLLQGLTLNGLSAQTLPDQFQNLTNLVLGGDVPSNLQQGAAVFPGQSLQVSQSYLDLVQTKYGGKAQTVAYTMPHEAMDTINSWAQDQTGDRVQDLVSQLDPQTQLLVASAASYQARFSPPFNASLSQEERFLVDSYHVAMVPMMSRTGKFSLAYDPAVRAGVLKLPMADGTAMLAVLPDEDVDIGAVEDELTAEKVQSWIRRLKKTWLEVLFPRFQLEHWSSLKDVLQTLDITQVFLDTADLSSMGGAKDVRLTEVYQKSVVLIDETSDDVTAQGGATTLLTPPPRLTFNRPFIFIIYQETTNSLLLLGRVSDPSHK